MWSLARLVLAFVVVFAVATFAVHLVGGTRPMPVATLFSNPDGSPCAQTCLFGIIPGQTTAREALLILKTHPLTSNVSYMETRSVIQSTTVRDKKSVQLGDVTVGKTVAGLVDYVQIEGSWQSTPTKLVQGTITNLGDVMAIVGSPRGIFDAKGLRVGSAYFEFFVGLQMLFAETHPVAYNSSSVDPHDNVSGLMLARWVSCSDYPNALVHWSMTPWSGLNTVSNYNFTPLTPTLHRSIDGGFLPCIPCQP